MKGKTKKFWKSLDKFATVFLGLYTVLRILLSRWDLSDVIYAITECLSLVDCKSRTDKDK